jgi:hypothetical protein
MKWFSLLFSVLFTSAYAAPDIVHANYDVLMSGMKVGQIEEIYSRNGSQYTLTSTTTPTGLAAVFRPGKVRIASRGLIEKQGLRPLHFEDKREGNPGKDSTAEFDWNQHLLTLTRQSQQTPLVLAEGTQDRLSAMYQFMFLQLAGELKFAMTNGNKLDNYHYVIGPLQKLVTPAGEFDTRYLDSQGKPGENRTEIWLETKYNLPCKMIITDANGEQLAQVLSGLKITP